MSELCLNLLTRQRVPQGIDPLMRIWSLDHWLGALDRVCGIQRLEESADRQRFILHFDAGRPEPDRVEVERTRSDARISVIHRIPPPGIRALSAEWWTEAEHPGVLFVCRRMLMDDAVYSPAMARNMFGLLRENIGKLIGRPSCDSE
ncbi:hypothetical protein [Serratia ureilytica]|uniref:hypothetical protein n=1 Tax=Serratia ureilytica TaxID=300181 RepID=UPI001D188B56|nr:hypothetical protein [Serratia ureilytica]MCC4107179.1 hypothetical protein [Serratia ureilytica]